MKGMCKILVIAAHPDDEILGCGGTIARLSQEGHEVFTLILGEGITSRDPERELSKRKKDLLSLKDLTLNASKIIGAKEVFFGDFPDNRFDSVPLLEIIKKIEDVKNKITPDIIYTHFAWDLNIDHQLTYRATVTAFRPLPGEKAKEIYTYEVLSSTEFNYPQTFSPNVYVDISATIEKKVEAMKAYRTEIRDWPHPRSEKALRILAQKRGCEVGIDWAEGFQLIRSLK